MPPQSGSRVDSTTVHLAFKGKPSSRMCGQTTTNDTALFVYGTLKRGFFNYSRYLGIAESDSKAVFVGDGCTIESYPMVVRPPNQTGSSGAPQLLDEAGKGFNVMGEVYLIDESTLKAMDILEGVHRGRYRRQTIQVQFETEEGYLRHMECATYFFVAEDPSLQELPWLENYTAEHNAAYVAKPVSDEILSLCQGPSTLRASCPKERTKLLHSMSQMSLASLSTSGSSKGVMSSDSLSPLSEAEMFDQAACDFELLEISADSTEVF